MRGHVRGRRGRLNGRPELLGARPAARRAHTTARCYEALLELRERHGAPVHSLVQTLKELGLCSIDSEHYEGLSFQCAPGHVRLSLTAGSLPDPAAAALVPQTRANRVPGATDESRQAGLHQTEQNNGNEILELSSLRDLLFGRWVHRAAQRNRVVEPY